MRVYGAVHLADGETVLVIAETMLEALKRATERYQEMAVSMNFWTVEDEKKEVVQSG